MGEHAKIKAELERAKQNYERVLELAEQYYKRTFKRRATESEQNYKHVLERAQQYYERMSIRRAAAYLEVKRLTKKYEEAESSGAVAAIEIVSVTVRAVLVYRCDVCKKLVNGMTIGVESSDLVDEDYLWKQVHPMQLPAGWKFYSCALVKCPTCKD